jgi:hypothetical protein
MIESKLIKRILNQGEQCPEGNYIADLSLLTRGKMTKPVRNNIKNINSPVEQAEISFIRSYSAKAIYILPNILHDVTSNIDIKKAIYIILQYHPRPIPLLLGEHPVTNILSNSESGVRLRRACDSIYKKL